MIFPAELQHFFLCSLVFLYELLGFFSSLINYFRILMGIMLALVIQSLHNMDSVDQSKSIESLFIVIFCNFLFNVLKFAL